MDECRAIGALRQVRPGKTHLPSPAPLEDFRGSRGEGLTQAMPKPLNKVNDQESREVARRLRRDSTRPEQRLWSMLRNRRLGGLKFRRQQSINPFFVDFCCDESRLI